MPPTPWPLVAVLVLGACAEKDEGGGGETDTTDTDVVPPMAYTPPMPRPHTGETGGTGGTGGSGYTYPTSHGTSPFPDVPIRP